jgi:hypothetical protein
MNLTVDQFLWKEQSPLKVVLQRDQEAAGLQEVLQAILSSC